MVDEEVAWKIQLGKKIFLQRVLGKPQRVITGFVGIFLLGFIFNKLVYEIYIEMSIKPQYSWIVIIILLVTLIIYTIYTNYFLFSDKVRLYKITKSGVEIDGILHGWKEFSFYYDQEKDVKENIRFLGLPIPYTKPDIYVIQLTKSRLSDAGKIVLYIDTEENYRKALQIVKNNISKSL